MEGWNHTQDGLTNETQKGPWVAGEEVAGRLVWRQCLRLLNQRAGL